MRRPYGPGRNRHLCSGDACVALSGSWVHRRQVRRTASVAYRSAPCGAVEGETPSLQVDAELVGRTLVHASFLPAGTPSR